MFRQFARLLIFSVVLYSAACGRNPVQSNPSSGASTGPASTVQAAVTSTLPPATSPVIVTTVTATRTPVQGPFTEEFDAGLAYWDFAQVQNGERFTGPVIRDGFLAFDFQSPDQWAYAIYSGASYTDVVVEVEAQSRTAGDGAAGVVCRYDEHKGWYELNVYFADQTYQLLFGQWLAPGVARFTPLYRDETHAIGPDTDQIGLQCQGNTLTPLINGAPQRKFLEGKFGLEAGHVGVSAASFEDSPFRTAFDWLKVSRP